MRFIVDFNRYPRAVAVMVIEYARGDGFVRIETPVTDSYMRWLYAQRFDVPCWWIAWNSTQDWIAETYGTERAA